MQQLHTNKERILSTLRGKGPSFPTRIARETGMQPLFVAALLAELVTERRVKLSNMKVGSSPIYFLDDQEEKLIEFSHYLGHKEQEAFTLLKDNAVLDDNDQHPAIRVALRKLKDFAVPVSVRIDGESKLFWRFFTVSESETKERIRQLLTDDEPAPQKVTPTQKPESVEKQSPETTNQKQESEIQAQQQVSPQEEQVSPQNEEKMEQIFEDKETTKETPKPSIQEKPSEESSEKKESAPVVLKDTGAKPKAKVHEFPAKIKKVLDEQAIDIVKEITSKKKEFVATVKHQTRFGPQEYLLTAKEKKKITRDDLTIALQNAQTHKMPAFVLSPGAPDKKAKEYAHEWRNLVKFEQIDD